MRIGYHSTVNDCVNSLFVDSTIARDTIRILTHEAHIDSLWMRDDQEIVIVSLRRRDDNSWVTE